MGTTAARTVPAVLTESAVLLDANALRTEKFVLAVVAALDTSKMLDAKTENAALSKSDKD